MSKMKLIKFHKESNFCQDALNIKCDGKTVSNNCPVITSPIKSTLTNSINEKKS